MGLQARLDELEARGLRRRLRQVSGPQGPRVVLDGKPVLLLCSNNYLGLADHPDVREAAADAAMRWGVGAGASRLVSGSMTIHRRLEERLAAFKGTETALLFGSGYLANVGVVGALAAGSDADRPVVFSDELNHASIVDGCRLARAETVVYRHADVEHLAWGLRRAEGRAAVIVTDSVFSMDGDVAPLQDSRCSPGATGCASSSTRPTGRAAWARAAAAPSTRPACRTRSTSSSGRSARRSAPTGPSRPRTARPPAGSSTRRGRSSSRRLPHPRPWPARWRRSGARRGRPERAERLQANAGALRDALAREGFEVAGSTTQVVPLVVGDAGQAMRVCERALEDGVFAQAIRPPTVPEGTSRLRLAVMASHTRAELREAARVLARAALRAGFRPGDGVPAVAAREADPGPGAAAARRGRLARRCAASWSRAPTPAPARPS